MEYRIEDLARVAGVAVDTVRFYQGRGLLPPPRREGRVTWYGDVHLDRLQRIRALQQRGFSLAVIRRFLEGELEPSDEALVAALTAPLSSDDGTMSLDELAARSGLPAAVLAALEQAEILVPVSSSAAGVPQFQSSDVQALTAGMRLLEAGIPLQELLALAGDHARNVGATARRAVQLFDRHIRERLQREGSDVDVSARLMQLFDELLDASAFLVDHHFRRALIRAAREHVERDPEISRADERIASEAR
jgi:DNA-binding transcriptional MerR regulator